MPHSALAPPVLFFVALAATARLSDATDVGLATSVEQPVLAPLAPWQWQGCVNVTPPAGGEVALCHYTDELGLRLGLAVRVVHEQAVSWAGVGLSSTGGMKGADLLVASQSQTVTPTQAGGGLEVKDYWSAGFFAPVEDTLNDVTTIAAGSTERNATHGATLWFVALRPLSRAAGRCEGKSQDLDVVPGRDVVLIYAFGTGSTTATAPTYHGTHRGKATVRLTALAGTHALPTASTAASATDMVVSSAVAPDEQRLTLGLTRGMTKSLTVPSRQTSYLCRLVELPAEARLVTHIELTVETNFTHHMLLFGCEGPDFEQELPRLSAFPENQWTCEAEMVPAGCTKVIWTYAFASTGGRRVYSLPAGKGVAIGGAAGTHAVVQMHFDNPQGQEGVRVLNDAFTLTHVPADVPGMTTLGTLTVGAAPIAAFDPLVIPPGREALLFDSICPIECTMQLPPGGVEIVYAREHGHRLARSLGLDIHRGAEVIPVTFLENYDYDQGTAIEPPVNTGVRIMPGDIIRKWCTFDSRGETNTTRGGQTTADEMCFTHLWTSPAVSFNWCVDLKHSAIRYDTPLHSLTSKLPASCYPGNDYNLNVLPAAGVKTSLAEVVEDKDKQSDMLDALRLLTFYDPIANDVPDDSPTDLCGPRIPGRLSRPPPRVGAEDAVDAAISFGGGTVCGPSNRAAEPSCPTPAAMLVNMAYWAMSILVGFLIFRRHFRNVTLARTRRNIVAYFVNLLVTSVALPTVLIAGAPLLFAREELDDPAQRLVWSFGFVAVATLYMWELVFRFDINPSLLCHHLCTIAFCLLFAITLFDLETNIESDFKRILQLFVQNDRAAAEKLRALNDARIDLMKDMFWIAIVLVLNALTEQPSFVALLMHRAHHRHDTAAFKVAAFWSGFSKTVLFILGVHGYATMMSEVGDTCDQILWCTVWRPMYPVLCVLLYSTQLWATYILHVLSKRPHGLERKTTHTQLQAGSVGSTRRASIIAGTDATSLSASVDRPQRKFCTTTDHLQEAETLDNHELEHEFDPMYLVENGSIGFLPAPRSSMGLLRNKMHGFKAPLTHIEEVAADFAKSSDLGQEVGVVVAGKRREFHELEEAGTPKISQLSVV